MATTSLHDFADVEPLEVREKVPIESNGHLIGWAGPSNRDDNVLVAHRHRHQYGDGEQDYFRKVGGYTFDETAILTMEAMGADIIAVLEVDNDRVLEFRVQQFRDSDYTSETISGLHGREDDELNIAVPIEKVIHTWDLDKCTIIDDH